MKWYHFVFHFNFKINQLKTENKHLNSDYELVKQEYQRTIERNEEILVENRRLRGIIQNTKISTPEKKSILGSDFRSEVIMHFWFNLSRY